MIVGRIEQLTERIGDVSRTQTSVVLLDRAPHPTSAELMEIIYRALKLSSCWCTEPVWYAPKATPIKCSRCKAIEAYERKHGVKS